MRHLPLSPELRAKLRELLEVDPTSPSGLRWKVRRGKMAAGSTAGSFSKSDGYWRVAVDGRKYLAHRLVWTLTHDEDPGDREIDHIDGKRGNNSHDNLRLATRGENTRNVKQHCDSDSRHKGVYRFRHHASWHCRVMVHGRLITKNFSDSKYGGREAAHAAAAAWAAAMREELHGEFARHG